MYTPTVDEIMALNPCQAYNRARVADLLHRGFTLETLLSLPPADARWILARLLPRDKAIKWARRCALEVASENTPEIVVKWLKTGKGDLAEVIAAAYAAVNAANAAVYADARVDAAVYAAAAADAYAAVNAATHKRQIKWALNLLNKGRLS
jgi:hypothetical protein